MRDVYVITNEFEDPVELTIEQKINFEKEWQMNSELFHYPKFFSLRDALDFIDDLPIAYKNLYRIKLVSSGEIVSDENLTILLGENTRKDVLQ